MDFLAECLIVCYHVIIKNILYYGWETLVLHGK